MSVKAVSWALDDVQGIHPTRKLVLIVMAEAAHSDGTASFVSQATIAKKVGISDRQVRDHVKALEQDGLISRGDQRHVTHIPANYRPTVWDMNLTSTGRLESMLGTAAIALPTHRHAGWKPTSGQKPASALGGNSTSGLGRKPSAVQGGRQGGSPLPTNQEPETKPREVEEVLPLCSVCGRGRENLYGGGVCSDCIEPQPSTPHPRRPDEGWAASIRADLQRRREQAEAQAGDHPSPLSTFKQANNDRK